MSIWLQFESGVTIQTGFLKYRCCGNENNENKFIDVLHANIKVSPEVVQRILNMKY